MIVHSFTTANTLGFADISRRRIMKRMLSGRTFMLGCGYHVSFGTNFGNDIPVINGKEPKIICSLCGH